MVAHLENIFPQQKRTAIDKWSSQWLLRSCPINPQFLIEFYDNFTPPWPTKLVFLSPYYLRLSLHVHPNKLHQAVLGTFPVPPLSIIILDGAACICSCVWLCRNTFCFVYYAVFLLLIFVHNMVIVVVFCAAQNYSLFQILHNDSNTP